MSMTHLKQKQQNEIDSGNLTLRINQPYQVIFKVEMIDVHDNTFLSVSLWNFKIHIINADFIS